MRLSVMAHAYADQDRMPGVDGMTFDERLAQMVDAEWDSRRTNKRVRLLRQARLSCPDARVADVRWHPDRKLDRSLIMELSNCTWVTDRRNVIITGATGSGKT
jgi:DNA replication protein DnaC